MLAVTRLLRLGVLDPDFFRVVQHDVHELVKALRIDPLKGQDHVGRDGRGLLEHAAMAQD